jgi:hypothetical protein
MPAKSRNHDELTLEMVTDEERDYTCRMHAHVQQARLNLGIRRRLAPLLGARTAALHLALSSVPDDPEFAPESVTQHYQRGVLQLLGRSQ